ncbi:MAG: SGNH/GDSL hydrolase family protein [Blautia sp.]|nr:SGNH/GDSL hydrolase family protein [Blautia sp.]
MTVLFLGDSITDSNHSFDPEGLGTGYVRMLHEYYNCAFPSDNRKHLFINKGFDGFTVSAVFRLWKRLQLQNLPDIITLLVGINDVGLVMDHHYSDTQIRAFARKFGQSYQDLVSDILNRTNARLILMEPFLFKYPAEYQTWLPTLSLYQEEIRRIADLFHLSYITLHRELNNLAETLDYHSITVDGIHLAEKGNRYLADQLIHEFDILFTP